MGHRHSKTDADEIDGGVGHQKVGMRFTSRMTGHMIMAGERRPCEFTVTLQSDDLKTMLERDSRHAASISGHLTCHLLSDQPIPFADGKFYVETSPDKKIEFKTMVYEARMKVDDKDFFFKGLKVSHDDTFVGQHATNTCSTGIVIKEGTDFDGVSAVVATAKVETELVNLAKELTDVEISCPDEDEIHSVEWKAKFGHFYGGILLDISNLFSPTQFCREAEARERRPLKLNGVKADVYHLVTTDGVPLVMTRYKCGNKGPILFLHGLCVTSRIFSLDTVETSVVEFLAEHGYDMWVPELRYSVSLPSHRKPTHINDSAEYDLPPIVDLILKTTGSPDLQVYAHCIGSLTIHVALFGRHVDKSKVRGLVASQSGFCMISTAMNHAKASMRLENIAIAFGFCGLNAYTDKHDPIREKIMTSIANLMARSTLDRNNKCENVVCHRITSMFGLMWEHHNLNNLTHETLSEWFGFGHAEFYRHLAVTFRKGRLTDIKGHDVYIPDFDSDNRLESAPYRKAMENLNIPILYYVGSLNHGWDIDSTRQSYVRCQEANPNQHYEWFEIPNYGHLDCVMGKSASSDVLPKILPFLDKFAFPGR